MDARLKSLPTEFITRLGQLVPPGRLKAVYDALLTQKPTTIRINTLKATEAEVLASLVRHQVGVKTCREAQGCHFLTNISDRKLRELDVYRDGKIYLQNLASQLPPALLDLKAGQRVLDLCASPGSKTSQMAALMQNEGHIDAVEPDPIRFDRLVHNLTHLGVSIAACHRTRGESFLKNLDPQITYDRILVDAPCSGEGTFLAVTPSSFYHWSPKFVETSAKLQKKLLAAACDRLKPGGKLLYSTCALSAEENEAVVSETLTQHAELQTLPIRTKKNSEIFMPPLSSWQSLKFHPQTAQAARILPSQTTEGFFLCLMTRLS